MKAALRGWRLDPFAIAAVIAAVVLGLPGIWWGWVEDWNPDQMAFLDLFSQEGLPFAPTHYLKPPFYTYINYFLAVLPVKAAENVVELLTGADLDWSIGVLYVARLLQLAFFAGTVALVYRIVADTDKRAAAGAAFLLATAAGFVQQAHFLTTDISVTFFMVLGFWLSQRILEKPGLNRYCLAGLAVGVATATKYNGLAVGLAIPVFHVLANPGISWWVVLFDRRLVIGVSMVVVGFVAANPFSLIEFGRFANDFIYNYVTTPAYGGDADGSSGFRLVVPRLAEIMGWPLTVAVCFGIVVSLARLGRVSTRTRAMVLAALAVVALYVLVFGRAPRLEVRFVLPLVPFLLIACAPAFGLLAARAPRIALALLVLLCLYGTVCSLWVGYRFASDPRMAAQAWVMANVGQGQTIESTPYAPSWNRLPGVSIVHIRTPGVSGRRRLFAQAFEGDTGTLDGVNQREEADEVQWYTAEALARRDPDFIAVHSMYADRFLTPPVGPLYPEIQGFFNDLLGGRLGYEVVFDEASSTQPGWIYPQKILFVDGRMLILRRSVRGN